ncbi:MAG: hypothetical protein M3256_00700 [Actinomycetota bacterium]|nr:hypothetical protein [Actinomycetota bacterium]
MINAQLPPRSNLHLQVHRWETMTAQKPQPGETVNDLFLAQARESHVTLVLLLTEIFPFTLKEVLAVLAEEKVDLSVLWFRDPDGKDDSALRAFLRDHQARFLYQELGEPDSEAAWLALFAALFRLVMTAAYPLKETERLLYERR